jgi:ATP-dependent Clp protease adaptor protein ClpS
MPLCDKKNTGPEVSREEEAGVATQERQTPQKPRTYKVLLHNDDYTTMDFVVFVLENVFHHTHEKAVEIMMQIHQKGVGLAGIYSFETAETKVVKVSDLAKQNQFPLRCSMEPQ